MGRMVKPPVRGPIDLVVQVCEQVEGGVVAVGDGGVVAPAEAVIEQAAQFGGRAFVLSAVRVRARQAPAGNAAIDQVGGPGVGVGPVEQAILGPGVAAAVAEQGAGIVGVGEPGDVLVAVVDQPSGANLQGGLGAQRCERDGQQREHGWKQA